MWHTENEMADGNCFSKFKSFFATSKILGLTSAILL